VASLIKDVRDYLVGLPTKAFDAYTHGVSTPDFVKILEEEIKIIKKRLDDTFNDLKQMGYKPAEEFKK
jgi:hypothetical protein